jgi:hypothetical protein
MLMLITSIRLRVMPYVRLMNTLLNITNSVHLMTLPRCGNLIVRF